MSNQARLRELSAPRIQAKLEIGPVNDPLERQADAAADQVMRMSDPAITDGRPPLRVMRKCAACEGVDTETLQAKHEGAGPEGGEAPGLVQEVLSSPGEPLGRSTRQFFEPRFAADFSNVRVHRDARAAQSARLMGARAYAVGNRIVFADNAYSPGAHAGRHLLAHELAHVVQQGAGPSLQRSPQPAESPAPETNTVVTPPDISGTSPRVQRVDCADYNDKSKALCEQQPCTTKDGADGRCKKTGMSRCACYPARIWREMLPDWVIRLLSVAAMAAIAACFATGACEFGAVVGGLGAAAAAAVLAVLKAAGIRDTGAGATADATQSGPPSETPQEAAA